MSLRDYLPRKRVLSAVFMIALVLGMSVGTPMFLPDRDGPVGDSEAIACGGLCVAAGVGLVAGLAGGYTVSEFLNGDETSATYTEADANETRLAVESHAKTVRNGQKTTDVIMTNQVVDGSRNIAWAKAKAAAIEALNNGESEANATDAAQQAVSDYYTTMEINYANQVSDSLTTLDYLRGVYDGHTSLSGSNGISMSTENDMEYESWTTEQRNYTTINGTVINVSIISVDNPDGMTYKSNGATWTGSTWYTGIYEDTRLGDSAHYQQTGPEYEYELVVDAYSNDSKTWTEVMYTEEGREVLDEINDADTQMRSNADMYVSNLYSSYNAGDINISDIPDPSTLSQEYSTDYNSTGYYAFAGADLMLMGVNTSLNESMQFTVNGTQTYNGTLFTNWEPTKTNGSWDTGVTYDTANASSPVFLATQEEGLLYLEGSFTIDKMTNTKTGESVNSTTTQNYNRQTSDASFTYEEMQQLLELQTELNEQKEAASGGSGSSLSSEQLVMIAVALGAIAMFMNNSGGGRNYSR